MLFLAKLEPVAYFPSIIWPTFKTGVCSVTKLQEKSVFIAGSNGIMKHVFLVTKKYWELVLNTAKSEKLLLKEKSKKL
jgi:hypothetical protein